MLDFYALALSSYCAKVRIILRLKSISFNEMTPPDGYGSAAYRAIVPAGSIPGIVHNGHSLHDSAAIAEYLNELEPQPDLLAADSIVKAKQRALSQFHDTRVEPAVRALFPLVRLSRRDANTRKQITAAYQQWTTVISRLGQLLPGGQFMGGNELCIADCAYPTTLRMGEDIFNFLGQSISLPSQLRDWQKQVEQNAIINEEVINNRAAVSSWLDTVTLK